MEDGQYGMLWELHLLHNNESGLRGNGTTHSSIRKQIKSKLGTGVLKASAHYFDWLSLLIEDSCDIIQY